MAINALVFCKFVELKIGMLSGVNVWNLKFNNPSI